jgi:hypothetical protein
MSSAPDNCLLEYQYAPSPDAEERLAEAWEIILALLLQDLEDEQTNSEGERC